MIRQVPKSPSFRQGERSEGWPESSCHGWQLPSIQLIYRHFDLSGYAVANLTYAANVAIYDGTIRVETIYPYNLSLLFLGSP